MEPASSRKSATCLVEQSPARRVQLKRNPREVVEAELAAGTVARSSQLAWCAVQARVDPKKALVEGLGTLRLL